jgi:MFS transporter, YNFM family, putative membrane transport protein
MPSPKADCDLERIASRPIVALTLSAFVAIAAVRVTDPLLPQLAREFATTPSGASIVSTSAMAAYGVCQVGYGPLGERHGKYTVVTVVTLLGAVFMLACAFVPSLGVLAALRLGVGAMAAAVVPLSIAYIADGTAYQVRQGVLARFLSGQILGMLAAQALGGIGAEYIGWRGVFAAVGTIYAIAGIALWRELRSPRVVERRVPEFRLSLAMARYLALVQRGSVQRVLAVVGAEGFLLYGALTFVGAFLKNDLGMSYSALGLVLACFGFGGLSYTVLAPHIVRRLGERGMMLCGGLLMAAGFAVCGLATMAWPITAAMATSGLGFYLMHNTLQTRASQMAPGERALGMSMFSCALFVSQAAGVTACAMMIAAFGYRIVFGVIALGLVALGGSAVALLAHASLGEGTGAVSRSERS